MYAMLQIGQMYYIYYLVTKVSYISLQPAGGCGKRRVALMKRIISVLAAMAIMAAMVVVMAMPAFAFANNANGSDAPGQQNARSNCFEVVENQDSNTGNGKKEGFSPTNCDKFFN